MPWQPSSKRCSVSSATPSHRKGDRHLCGGFARVNERIGCHMGMDELIDLFAEGDELVSNTAFEDLDLAYDVANGATFDGVVFRSCEFDGVDWSGSTFRDVVFRGCRFIRCNMEGCWLSRCDFVDCSAPGLNLLKARLSSVSFGSCDLSYANLSEGRIGPMTACDTRLREAAFQGAKLGQIRLDGCDLTRVDVFKTSLSGVDVSRCTFAAPVVSGDYHELRGLTVNAEQALALSGLLGIQLADE